MDDLPQKTFQSGSLILAEGDPGDAAYLVVKGKVEIIRGTKAGPQAVVTEVGPGGIFGEFALIDNKPRAATAMAAEPTVCTIISREVFQKLMKQTNPVIRALMLDYTKRLRMLRGD